MATLAKSSKVLIKTSKVSVKRLVFRSYNRGSIKTSISKTSFMLQTLFITSTVSVKRLVLRFYNRSTKTEYFKDLLFVQVLISQVKSADVVRLRGNYLPLL